MPETSKRAPSGFQIAFLIFAVLLLAVPADRYVFANWQWAKDSGFPIGRTMIFMFAGLVMLCFPSLRGHCQALLASPVRKRKQAEVLLVVVLNVAAAFAAAGLFALWWWSTGGEPALARRMGDHSTFAAEWARATAINAIVTSLVLGGILGPIIEELVFRGMLYPAWERQWGWLWSALATSLVFAIFHPGGNGVSQFVASLFFICLLRRTGSLRACIYAHSAFNVLLWFPLLGRYLFPAGRETGEISAWTFNLICLAFVTVAIPAYMWMARDEKAAVRVGPASPAAANS